MTIDTTENIAGPRTQQTLGQVFVLVVHSRRKGGDVVAGPRCW